MGLEFGLTVLLDQMLDDYSHTYNDFVGTNIFMMEPTDFLDGISGSMAMRLFQPEEELHVSLGAVPIIASENIRLYSPKLRGCLFDNENMLGKYASIS